MIGFSFLGLATIINSCKKDGSKTSLNSSVSAAKSWYESTYPAIAASAKFTVLNSNAGGDNNPDMTQRLKPDWNHASSYNRLQNDVVELPADPTNSISANVKAGIAGSSVYKKNNGKTALLLLNDGQNYHAYVMTIIADSAYLESDHSKLDKNNYRHIEKDFSGTILYFTPKGQFVSAWFYKNGVIVKKLSGAIGSVSNSSGLKIVNKGLFLNATPSVGGPKTFELQCMEMYADYYWGDEFLWTVDMGLYCYDDGQQSIARPPDNGSPAPGGPGTVAPVIIVVDTAKKNPCLEKDTITARQGVAKISTQNSQIAGHVSDTTLEYGANQNLTAWPGNTYVNTPVTPGPGADLWISNFTWDAINGYTIGASHDHPNGTGPSPEDIFKMLTNLQSTTLTSAGQSAVTYYQNHAYVTVVTSTNTYVVTVNDWDALKTVNNNYLSNPTAFDLTLVNNSKSTSYESALLTAFGDSINLYTDTGTPGSFYPIKLNPTTKALFVPCN